MIHPNFIKHTAALLAGFGLLAVGCGDSGTGSDTQAGSFEVRLHDAPASYDAVNVFIERVEVNRQEDPEGWITISEPQKTFDLIGLTNGAYAVLGDTTLEAGTYHQIRLILSQDGHSVVFEGQEHDMFVPSGVQTGVKLEVNAEISEDIQYVLLLDFDASRSVVEAGQQNQQLEYLLTPVITATNQAITGNIEGTISPADAEPVVYAIVNSDTLASTYADTTNGYFKLIGLEEGTYNVTINPTNTNSNDSTLTGVSVTVDQTTDVGTIDLN